MRVDTRIFLGINDFAGGTPWLLTLADRTPLRILLTPAPLAELVAGQSDPQ
ncbi:hypothetical protein H0B43_17210 [Rhodococcus wratislaviensis]|nr:hypothetical protein [Rhodococcus sp. 4CII]